MNWETVINDFLNFSIPKFKNATPLSSMKKLDKEALEVRKALQGDGDLAEEYADCLMCIFDSAMRVGLEPNDLLIAMGRKTEINKNRRWIENSDKTYSHF